MPGGSGERVVRSDLSVGSITLCLDCGLCVCMRVCVRMGSVGSWEDIADTQERADSGCQLWM